MEKKFESRKFLASNLPSLTKLDGLNASKFQSLDASIASISQKSSQNQKMNKSILNLSPAGRSNKNASFLDQSLAAKSIMSKLS